MFEKIGRAAEKAANSVSLSRRGFLSRAGSLAAGAALGVGVFLTPTGAWAKPFKCHCNQFDYGCSPNDAACIDACAINCQRKK
jgi:hypothetical protein